jgi:hypothetical protein
LKVKTLKLFKVKIFFELIFLFSQFNIFNFKKLLEKTDNFRPTRSNFRPTRSNFRPTLSLSKMLHILSHNYRASNYGKVITMNQSLKWNTDFLLSYISD